MKKWNLKNSDEKLVKALSYQTGLSEILVSLLVNKGVNTKRDIEKFVKPKISDLHNPFIFSDMAKAVDRIRKAIDSNEKILIYGDRDVDGISSVNLAVLYLSSLKADVSWYIPSTEGYGLHKEILTRYSESGIRLIITVDCGINACEEIDFANSLGMDVIITDHHEPPAQLPDAYCVIDPKCESSGPYPFKELAGCGVAFKLFQAVAFSFSEYYNKDIVVFDVETSGLSPYMDEILEIGAVKIKNFIRTDSFSTFVKPKNSIPPGVTRIHGITDEMCSAAPDINSAIGNFLSFASDAVLVAHNASFDVAFVQRASVKIKKELKNQVIDTLDMSRSITGFKSHALQSLACEFDIPVARFHRALDDAITTSKVFERLVLIQEKGQRKFIEKYLYLVSLGTIADIVPLVSENRIFVKYGIPLLYASKKPGIRLLIENLGIEKKMFTAKKISWSICPLINAAGRIGMADVAAKLLLTDSYDEVSELFDQLVCLNKERRRLQKENIEKFLLATSEQNDVSKDKIIITVAEGLKHGVTGIVAGELVKRFSKPVILLILDGEEAMGAARSVAGVDIVSIIENCEDILVKYGGHKAAAGLTIKKRYVEEFRKRIKSLAERTVSCDPDQSNLSVDGIVFVEDVTVDLIKELSLLEPCGCGNPYPVFAINGVELSNVSVVGSGGAHLKAYFRDSENDVGGIGWRMGGHANDFKKGELVDVAFQLEINVWQSRESAQLLILDMKSSAAIDDYAISM